MYFVFCFFSTHLVRGRGVSDRQVLKGGVRLAEGSTAGLKGGVCVCVRLLGLLLQEFSGRNRTFVGRFWNFPPMPLWFATVADACGVTD